jgi:hypothetical protein
MWNNSKYPFLLLILISITCCNTTEPPPDEQSITLKLEDVSCIEAWLKLTTTNLQLPATIELKRNDVVTQDIILSSADTMLYIDSLFPNTSYQYQVSSNEHQVSSNELRVTTMDTTSHNFTFKTWTFGGEAGSCTLYDVAIISEDNIWCVGEINIADTSINGYTTYNAIHWDGTNWNLHQIMFYTICGQQSRTPYPAKAIFAFDEDNIWIAMDGDQVAKVEGLTQVETFCLPASFAINKMWGQNSTELYAVGNGGNIARHNGISWNIIPSGTSVDIHDIWGSVNNTTGEKIILAIASFQNYGKALDLLKITGQSVIKLDTTGLRIAQSSIWFKGKNKTYIVGDGVFFKNNLSSTVWQQEENHPLLLKRLIRGIEMNDIFIVGDFGLVSHYNGIIWHHYTGNELPDLNGSFYSVDFKNNIMVAVGELNSGQAIVLKGDR